MENFIYDDEFYHDLGDLLIALEIDEDSPELTDDWEIECIECELEPVFKLSVDFIFDHINEERFTEDGAEADKIEKVLRDNIDFDKINSLIPQLYYPTKKKFTIKKTDVLEYCN